MLDGNIANRYIASTMLSAEQLDELRKSSGAPNRLRKAMELGGLTQVRLAEGVGVTQSHISEIVNGNYSRLPMETARNLAGHFGCSLEDLFPSREAVA